MKIIYEGEDVLLVAGHLTAEELKQLTHWDTPAELIGSHIEHLYGRLIPNRQGEMHVYTYGKPSRGAFKITQVSPSRSLSPSASRRLAT